MAVYLRQEEGNLGAAPHLFPHTGKDISCIVNQDVDLAEDRDGCSDRVVEHALRLSDVQLHHPDIIAILKLAQSADVACRGDHPITASYNGGYEEFTEARAAASHEPNAGDGLCCLCMNHCSLYHGAFAAENK